jgi:hypothetical protein
MNRVSVLLAHLQPAAASVAPAVVSGAKKPLKVVITGAAGQVPKSPLRLHPSSSLVYLFKYVRSTEHGQNRGTSRLSKLFEIFPLQFTITFIW